MPSQNAFAEAKGSNPTTGLTLLWARNPFRGHQSLASLTRKSRTDLQNTTRKWKRYHNLNMQRGMLEG
jgi:hypothetical protein